MDTGILDVLPVQATLIPKILLKLLLDEAHHRLPAGGVGRVPAVRDPDHSGGQGARLARTVGVRSRVLAPTKDVRGNWQVRCWEAQGILGPKTTRNSSCCCRDVSRAGQTSPESDPSVSTE